MKTGPFDESNRESEDGVPRRWPRMPTKREIVATARLTWRGYVGALIAVAIVSAVMLPVRSPLGVINIVLIYVALSLALGLVLGAGPASIGSVVAFFAFDFLFIPPYYTADVANRHHVFALFVYLAISVVTSVLVSRVRARAEEARRESHRTTLLYDLNRALVQGVTLDQILQTIVENVVLIYGSMGCRVLVRDGEGLRSRASSPPQEGPVDRQAATIALWVIEHRLPAGLSSEGRRIRQPHGRGLPPKEPLTRKQNDVLYVPVATDERVIGVLEVSGKPGGGRFAEEDARLLTSFADQAALAVERARLADEEARARVLEQTNELKSALLAAVSHDLRTPLAAIKASATALLDTSVEWDTAARDELLSAIDGETDRLTLMVSNLLDLSRIEGGALRPDKDWHDIGELLADAQVRLLRQTEDHPLTIDVAPDLPVVSFDYVEIAQVVLNLIGNAAKYSPAGSPILVTAQSVGSEVQISVRDHGMGIPPDRLPHIFETFYRAHEHGPVAGSGIGLAICKGLVEAHGGRIWAQSRVGEGTMVTFSLPNPRPVLTPLTEEIPA
ncbi:MAG TPA: ATP-binding protein [Thermomicrobiales bacterium]|nr:ATP-binding protein [Thermomicrobiales bacterium]